ncbi:hypothetical protein B0H17DRAFT_1152120 [Mycena rosella]|uniref:Ribonuclease H1 N-terminal domain-containing protein n=1 Tax=Mycena rosella TaxID=1033263 RepID=A0AAD7BG90_MYCRO|nr:hypothetical protein B0H17DRAFT_1152120 [Mycena rosella]
MPTQIAHLGPSCRPQIFPADSLTAHHDAKASCFYYVVFVGRLTGIFLHLSQAEMQVHGAHRGHMAKFKTIAGAEAAWAAHCRRNHEHEHSYAVEGCDKIFQSRDAVLAELIQRFNLKRNKQEHTFQLLALLPRPSSSMELTPERPLAIKLPLMCLLETPHTRRSTRETLRRLRIYSRESRQRHPIGTVPASQSSATLHTVAEISPSTKAAAPRAQKRTHKGVMETDAKLRLLEQERTELEEEVQRLRGYALKQRARLREMGFSDFGADWSE